MSLVAIIPGVAIPALVGWLLLDLLEGKTPLLWRCEKWVMGYALGLTFSMFITFIANVFLGVPLTRTGFALIFGVLIAVPAAAKFLWKRSWTAAAPAPMTGSRPALIALAILGGWVALRVVLMSVDVLATPTYFDDSMDNWNLRAKIYQTQENFSIAFPWDPNPGVSSYPPAVPLAKTWFVTIAGTWTEALANSVHPLWFASLLLLLYWSLRRMLPMLWATLGVIVLASLPLELMQGTNAYADVFLSLHVFIAASLVFHAVRDSGRAHVWLRLAAFAIALLPFTKNEGWALYFPVLGFLFVSTLIWLFWNRQMSQRQLLQSALLALGLAAIIAVPWIGFKLVNGLAFGNAKGLDLNLEWQPGVFTAVFVNTFLEGNWGLLFPLFFGLLIARWRTAFASPLLLLTACFAIPYLGQLFLYFFTGLSNEALQQTGYARGIIHIVPVVVMLTVLLVHDVLYGKKAD